MKRLLQLAVVVVLAVVGYHVATGRIDLHLPDQAATPDEQRQDGGGGGGPTVHAERTPAAAKTTAARTADAFPGRITTSYRGTSGNVYDPSGKAVAACGNIKVEIRLEAYGGPARWTGTALSGSPTGSAAPDVVIDPASGQLDDKQTRTVRIRGTFTGDRFYVRLADQGGSAVTIEFVC